MSAADDERELLRDTVERLLAEHCVPERVAAAAKTGWDATAWRALERTGLTLVGSPEELGGSGGDLASAADIAVAAGAAAAPVPLTETLAAGMLLAHAGLPIPPGPLTLAVTAHRQQTLCRVPYGRLATTVAVGVDEGGEWLAVAAHPVQVRLGRNMAGEPRDDVSLGADTEVRGAGAGTADYAQRLRRLFRSLVIAGAAQRALELSLAYVTEREQFGRSLAKLPTIQQELARMAGEVALISAATQAAVADDPPAEGTIPAVLAAKAQASQSAGIVAAIAHQLHGAIGTTEEHHLRLTTTRLWSWRDEDSPAGECLAELGRAAIRAGSGGLWPWLSGSRAAGGGQGSPPPRR
jgi:acyl-CoA dehydrogenase